MFCSKCGRKIAENQQFCDGCGAKNLRYKADVNNELQEVVSKAMLGNEKAIEKIYSITYAQGFSVAFQMMKNEQDALDVMQESYISAFRNLKKLEQPEKIKSWFNRIVANKCKDLLVKKKRNPQFFSDMQGEDDDREFEESIMDEDLTFSPEESVDYSETKRLMKQILENLPDEQRLCVLMYYYDELSVGEIAEALDCSTNTVKSRLNYARKKIKMDVEELEKKGTKLYSIAPIPFMVWMLRMGESGIAMPVGFAASIGKAITLVNGSVDGVMSGAAEHMSEDVAKKVVQETAKTATKETTKKAMITKIVAGITSVAVLGGGFAGYQYLKEKQNKNTETVVQKEQNREEAEEKAEPVEEKVEKLTLSTEQITMIQNASHWFDELQSMQDGYWVRTSYTMDLKNNHISTDVLNHVASAVVCTNDALGVDAGPGDSEFLLMRETMSVDESKEFLENTFGYKASSVDDLKNVFEFEDENDVLYETAPWGDADTIYETKRFAQTGENEYHFYTDVKPFGEYNYELAGVMDITAHKNEESKIGGFVFDKIEFTLKDEYQTSINDDVNLAVESMVRTKGELNSSGLYAPEGGYDVNQYSDKEFVFYADMFMTSALCFSNDREIVENDEGIYDGYQSLVTKYDDVCRNTLGRNEDYDMSGINKIDGDRVIYGGFMFDAWFEVEQEQIIQSLDGTIEMKGILEDHSTGERRTYQFKATGYASEKSKMGMVIDKVEVYQ